MRKNLSWTAGDDKYYSQYQQAPASTLIAMHNKLVEAVGFARTAEIEKGAFGSTPSLPDGTCDRDTVISKLQAALREENADPAWFPAEPDEDEIDDSPMGGW